MIIAFKINCDGSGDEKVWRRLDIGLPGDGQRQHHRVRREYVEQAEDTVLVEHHEAHQHHASGEKMRSVEGKAFHQKLRETNSNSVPRRPSISAPPTNSGTRNTRILAIAVSNNTIRKLPMASLPTQVTTPTSMPRAPSS